LATQILAINLGSIALLFWDGIFDRFTHAAAAQISINHPNF
jgi:hypothetical protein